MRLVVDTNVFISAVFFRGTPYEILDAWRRRKVELVASSEILDEYRRAGEELSREFGGVDLDPWLRLVDAQATVIDAPPLQRQVCSDPDDDKFHACAVAGRVRLIASGDKALLKVSGYSGVVVMTPRSFVDRHLR